MSEQERTDSFLVASLVSASTFQPMVNIELNGVAIQVTPEQARMFANHLSHAASAAEADAALVVFTRDIAGDEADTPETMQMAAMMLERFRAVQREQHEQYPAVEGTETYGKEEMAKA